MKFFLKTLIIIINICFITILDQDIKAWSETDTPVNTMTIDGTSEFFGPSLELPYGKVAIGSSGRIYIADSENHEIKVYEQGGRFLFSFGNRGDEDGEFYVPYGLAIDNYENIYVMDSYNYRVQKFNSQGQFLMKFGSYGTGNGQFDGLSSAVIDNAGNIYVADTNNNRIQKFNSSGEFLLKFGSYGTGDGQFKYPVGISVDISGNMYVADTSNHRIQKFNSLGVFLIKFGSYGAGDGQLYYPYNISFYNSNGNLLVADHSNDRVQEFTPSGSYVSKYSGVAEKRFFNVTGVSVDQEDNIYVTDSSNSRIQVYTSLWNFLYMIGWGEGEMANPESVYVDNDGLIYIVDSGYNRVQIYNSNGDYLSRISSGGRTAGYNAWAKDVVVDENKNIYIMDYGNYCVQKFNSSGELLLKFGSQGVGDGQFSWAQGIALDSLGNIYVADTGNYRIQKFNSFGVFLMKFGSNGTNDGQFKYPNDLIVDDEGNIFVVDTNNNRIQKFNSSGVFLMKFGTYGVLDGQFSSPRSLDLDINGNIYVVDKWNSRIQKFDPNGVFLMKFGIEGSGSGEELLYPSMLDIDNEGNIFIAETNNQRIKKFVFDKTAPTGSMNIDSSNPYTTSTNVTLTFNSIDDLTNVTQMIVCNDPTFTGCSWESYNQTKEWVLEEGLGDRTVYVKFVDEKTNISEVYSDTIEVKSPLIRITDIGLIDDVPDREDMMYYFTSTRAVIKGETNSNGGVYFTYGGNTYTTDADSIGDFEIVLTVNNGTNNISYYAEDTSGNITSTRTLTLIVGTEYFPDWLLIKLGLLPEIEEEEEVIEEEIEEEEEEEEDIVIPEIEDETKTAIQIIGFDGDPLRDTEIEFDGISYITDGEGYIYVIDVEAGSHALVIDFNGQVYTQQLVLGEDDLEGGSIVRFEYKADYTMYVIVGCVSLILMTIVFMFIYKRRGINK